MKKYILAFIIGSFGLLTTFLTTSIIFDLFGIREKEGNFVPFIIGVNFICGIIYLVSALGFIKESKWVFKALRSALIILVLGFIGLLIHVNGGGIHETKTIYAMLFRMMVTGIFTIFAYFTITKKIENEL